jgi:hypothetical protein
MIVRTTKENDMTKRDNWHAVLKDFFGAGIM